VTTPISLPAPNASYDFGCGTLPTNCSECYNASTGMAAWYGLAQGSRQRRHGLPRQRSWDRLSRQCAI
jgi:hypothetical protein